MNVNQVKSKARDNEEGTDIMASRLAMNSLDLCGNPDFVAQSKDKLKELL